MSVDKPTFDKLCNLLFTYTTNENDRKAWISAALYGCAVVPQIDWGGSAKVFTVNLLNKLDEYGDCKLGQSAIDLLLEGLKDQVGANVRRQIETLQLEMNRGNQEQSTEISPVSKPQNTPKTHDNSSQLVSKVGWEQITVGRSKIEFDDKEKIVNIMKDIAYNSSNDSGTYFKNLLRKTKIQQSWQFEVVGRLTNNPETDSRTLTEWAISKGTNPQTGESTLGDILLNIYDGMGLEDRNFISAMIASYQLSHDTTTLRRLSVPSRMTSPLNDYVGFGPEFKWHGAFNADSEVEYQSWLQPIPQYQDVGFLKKMIERSKLVCRIEIVGNQTYGTGVLISPYYVLTNFHTFTSDHGDVREANLQFKLLFNHYSGQDKRQEDTVDLNADSSIICESPTSKLDFVLLRLDEPRYEEPELTVCHNIQMKGGLNILQHPMGEEMKLAIGLTTDTITYVDKNSGILQYVTRTNKGSSGAPCFDDEWNFVGIHHAERSRLFGTIREGILYSAIEPLIRAYL